MKTTRYRFEQAIEHIKDNNLAWLKDEFKSILESDKDFTRKADYIGLSILSIDDKVSSLDEEIKELQELKKQLKLAKETALKLGAEIFSEYGITKIEGAAVSSITVTPQKVKEIKTLDIQNEAELMRMGYVKELVDEEEVMKSLQTLEGKYELLGLARLVIEEVPQEARIKINKRRSKSSNDLDQIKDVA